MGAERRPKELIHHVQLTDARNLSPLFEAAVGKGLPIMITRHRREYGVLMARDQALRLLRPYDLHVDVIPEEEDGGFSLWVRELNIGSHGATILEARARLLEEVRAYVRHYLDSWDFYRHLPDMAAQEPRITRLSLAESDEELIEMLFGAYDADPPQAGQSVRPRL